MYLKISIYKMPISVAFFETTVPTGHHWQQNCLLNCKLDFLQHFWRDKVSSTFVSLCEDKLRLDDNSPRFRTEPGNRTTFLQWYPTDMIQRGRITGQQGEGCENQPSLPASSLGRSDNEGTMGLGATKDLFCHSTSSILFRMQIRCQLQFVFWNNLCGFTFFFAHPSPPPFVHAPVKPFIVSSCVWGSVHSNS